MMNPEGLADFVGRSRLCRPKSEGKPHMIDFVELASLGCKLYLFVIVIVVNHVGFMEYNFFGSIIFWRQR